MYPFILYVDLNVATTEHAWNAVGEMPFMYYQRYGLTWNMDFKQEGKSYHTKVFGNPANYQYFIYDVTP
jgi:hypothetical protein